MKKCDVCKRITILPEILGDAVVCKICFIKIQGPIWKYRKFENLKDADKAKNKALKLVQKANYPEIVSAGIEKYFECNNANMKQCDACKETTLATEKVGKSNLCKNCFVKITLNVPIKAPIPINPSSARLVIPLRSL